MTLRTPHRRGRARGHAVVGEKAPLWDVHHLPEGHGHHAQLRSVLSHQPLRVVRPVKVDARGGLDARVVTAHDKVAGAVILADLRGT